MNIAGQYEFVTKQLYMSAQSVGIDLDESGDALICLWAFSTDVEAHPLSEYCNADEYDEAHKLIKKFSSKMGSNLIFFLGESNLFRCGKTGYGRDWEHGDGATKGEDAENCSFSKGRALCDFAMSVGHASHLCAQYLSANSPSKAGGAARAKKYKHEASTVESMFRSMTGLSDMSADEAAGHIMGRPGVTLSHRKIADIIRKARKVHDAKHSARSA